MSLESASSRLIAVTFSGWLNVTIPDAGRDARRFLVEPLGADVLICADTCTPEPYCTYGLCVAASRVPCVPRRRAAWTGSATHCTYAVRVPAWDACCTTDYRGHPRSSSRAPSCPRTARPPATAGACWSGCGTCSRSRPWTSHRCSLAISWLATRAPLPPSDRSRAS
eukprot:scaffold123995_cov48-Phaeocystis_antarctica.AAC.2